MPRRRLCRTSGGQCEYLAGENSARFTLRYCAVNDLQRLVFCGYRPTGASSKVVYAYLTYMGLGLCYKPVNIPYGSLATAMTQQPQSRARLGAAPGLPLH